MQIDYSAWSQAKSNPAGTSLFREGIHPIRLTAADSFSLRFGGGDTSGSDLAERLRLAATYTQIPAVQMQYLKELTAILLGFAVALATAAGLPPDQIAARLPEVEKGVAKRFIDDEVGPRIMRGQLERIADAYTKDELEILIQFAQSEDYKAYCATVNERSRQEVEKAASSLMQEGGLTDDGYTQQMARDFAASSSAFETEQLTRALIPYCGEDLTTAKRIAVKYIKLRRGQEIHRQ